MQGQAEALAGINQDFTQRLDGTADEVRESQHQIEYSVFLVNLGGGFSAESVVQLHSFGKASFFPELIQFPDDLPAVASEFVLVLFEFIEFFDHDHRQDYYIIFEALYRIGAVKKHVGIQNESFSHIAFLRGSVFRV